MTSAVRIEPLTGAHVAKAAELHRDVLDMEFLSRYGPDFMRTYYRAWLEAPKSIALAAVDEHDHLVGALLGALDPAAHSRAMVREHGVNLAARLAVYALGHPALAKDLVVTRGSRYVRGLARLVRSRSPMAGSEVDNPAVGEITHVLVRPESQGSGVGRALVDAAVDAAIGSNLDELVLVTPPEQAARVFYERLGWLADGEIVSRSGEPFIRYRFPLRGAGQTGSRDSPPVPG